MRNAIYRGMMKDGEWIEGYLIENKIYTPEHAFVSVKPETIGKKLSFEDKNGNPIFEDDILLSADDDPYLSIIAWDNEKFYLLDAEGLRITEPMMLAKGMAVVGNIHNVDEVVDKIKKQVRKFNKDILRKNAKRVIDRKERIKCHTWF